MNLAHPAQLRDGPSPRGVYLRRKYNDVIRAWRLCGVTNETEPDSAFTTLQMARQEMGF